MDKILDFDSLEIQDKAEFSLGIKSAGTQNMEMLELKKFYFFVKKLFTKL